MLEQCSIELVRIAAGVRKDEWCRIGYNREPDHEVRRALDRVKVTWSAIDEKREHAVVVRQCSQKGGWPNGQCGCLADLCAHGILNNYLVASDV